MPADRRFEVDEIVVAAGRTPTSRDIGLERIGLDVSHSHGYLAVDDHMAVIGGGDWLYAIGDVCGRALLTHMGKYQARIAGDVIAARAEGRRSTACATTTSPTTTSSRRWSSPIRRSPRSG